MLLTSIRFKVTILYMAILAVTLSVFSVILFHNVSVGLYGNMDALLRSKAIGISQAIDTYWEASRLEPVAAGDASIEISRKRRNVNFSRIAQRWVKEESADPALIDIMVQVFDTDGIVIASSKNTQGLAEISRQNFITVLQGKNRFDTVKHSPDISETDFRIYTTPVFENEKVAYIVQVSSPLTSIYIALNNLRIWLFLLFPITVFVMGIMGSFLAKAALRPVDSIIKTIHQITAENMKLKLAVPQTKDEIQKLAETFNEMLQGLDRAFTSQRQLFEDLSHELKTPLTILKGEFEVILKKFRSREEYETVLKSALEEVNTIIRLAENILLLAKFDAKQVSLNKKTSELGGLIDGVVNSIRAVASLNEVEIYFSIMAPIPLELDEGQFKIMFRNILDNAVKYTPPKGSVRVTAYVDKDFAGIRVEDTGVGIPVSEIDHIFDRFYRVDKSRQRSGFGLGLSIAKSIAEAHGGAIKVNSLPGKGSAFTILLPIYRS
jgi:heavy metal sensor kinase